MKHSYFSESTLDRLINAALVASLLLLFVSLARPPVFKQADSPLQNDYSFQALQFLEPKQIPMFEELSEIPSSAQKEKARTISAVTSTGATGTTAMQPLNGNAIPASLLSSFTKSLKLQRPLNLPTL